MSNDANALRGPSWHLDDEYPAASGEAIERDLAALDAGLTEIETLNPALVASLPALAGLLAPQAGDLVDTARRAFARCEENRRLLGNLAVYANCRLSVDANDDEAQALQGRLQGYHKRAAELTEPLSQFLDRAGDEVIERYLDDPRTEASAFQVRHSRERRHELLGLAEENLVSALSQDGIYAWGRLYTQLSSTLQCEVDLDGGRQRMGLAQASGLMQRDSEAVRRAAWRGINAAWGEHTETCAAALNAIAGWRLEMCRKRSHTRAVHFLDTPLHLNRIERGTLDTLLGVCARARPLAQRAARAMARAGGREQLGPWDLRAPAPHAGAEGGGMPFDEATDLIAGAYAGVAPQMGEFIRMMVDRRWIEGTVSAHKRPGAYCTGFPRSRHPRVYMTYTGSDSDIITLAHELGHAYHAWVMRDLPDSQRSYGMSLAETASTFGETAVRDALLQRAPDAAARAAILWEEISALPTFVLNIPARYAFEHALYTRRAERPLRPAELEGLMAAAWSEWYGEAMSEPDPLFWASKLHFYIAGFAFYNFPYLFGYLFSTGVYVRRAEWGEDFYPRYEALLRDTGRMSAEALAAKHLEVALGEPAFWDDTIARLEPRVAAYEALVNELG